MSGVLLMVCLTLIQYTNAAYYNKGMCSNAVLTKGLGKCAFVRTTRLNTFTVHCVCLNGCRAIKTKYLKRNKNMMLEKCGKNLEVPNEARNY